MQRLFCLLCLLLSLAAAPVLAQDDDRGYLQGLLEDALSDAGRVIRLDGFAGALSSRATVDRLTIADEDGIWLQADDLALSWNRAALLSGRIEVGEISVGHLSILRAPAPAPASLPAPEAQPFALPELPVAVLLEQLRIARIDLSADILGEPVSLNVDGTAVLDGGSGVARLKLNRMDGPEGSFALATSFENATRHLVLDLSAHEDVGGLAATLLAIPEAPSLHLEVAGAGPLNAFEAGLKLTANGTDTLRGALTIGADDSGTRFDATLGGDLRPLLSPDLHEFVGPSARLAARGLQPKAGGLDLQALSLDTGQMKLSGAVLLDEQMWPARLDLTGLIAAQDGAPVRLALPGLPTQLTRADIDLTYDAAKGEAWSAKAALSGLNRPDVQLDTARIEANGEILHRSSTALGRVTGAVRLETQGFSPADAGLRAALGPNLSSTLQFDWSQDAPLKLSEFLLTAAPFTLGGTMEVQGFGGPFEPQVQGRFLLDARDLSAFSALSGQALSGKLRASIEGQAKPLDGTFAVDLDGVSPAMAVGVAQVDALLDLQTQLTARIERDTAGTRLPRLELKSKRITLDAQADLSSNGGSARFDLALPDIGLLNLGLSGPLKAQGTARGDADAWAVEANLSGPAGSQARVSGTVAADGTRAALDLTGAAPLVLANTFTAPNLIDGLARFDLRLDGPLALNSVSGRIFAPGTRIVLPGPRLTLTEMQLDAELSNGRAQIVSAAALSSGGRAQVRGDVSLEAPFQADLNIDLIAAGVEEPGLVSSTIDGSLRVTGALAGSARILGDLTLGPTEIRVAETGMGTSASAFQLTHIAEPAAVRTTRRRAGLLDTSGGAQGGSGLSLDITLSAPGQIFVRGRGLDAELGGSLRLTGTTAAIVPIGQFELIRGRLDILGRRLTLARASALLRGSFDPRLDVLATSSVDDTEVQVRLSGLASAPEVEFSSSPERPEEEVLALLLFGRSVQELSAFQALRIAAAVNTLAGRGGAGILERMRRRFGVADLDVTTNADGTTQLSIGTYLTEQIYSDVSVDAKGETEINLNLRLGPNVTGRGSVNSSGETGVGVFFEKDY